MATRKVLNAVDIMKKLNGLFAIYKPPGITHQVALKNIAFSVCESLNEMSVRPIRQLIKFVPDLANPNLPTVTTVPDLSDDPLVIGKRYREEDIELHCLDPVAQLSSGVMVLGIGHTAGEELENVRDKQLIKVYHVTGKLGRTTMNYMTVGTTAERSTYKHVKLFKIARVLSKLRANHHKYTFQAANIDITSQEAFDRALTGQLRAGFEKTDMIVYNAECIKFSPPYFTLELHVINEKTVKLAFLIHCIGQELRTGATCDKIRRIRFGPLGLSYALVDRMWTAECIAENIALCHNIICGVPRTEVLQKLDLKDAPPQIAAGQGNIVSSGNCENEERICESCERI